MADIVLERSGQTLCPICNEPLDKDFKTAEYNGQSVWIHKRHLHPDDKIKQTDTEESK